MSERSFLIIGQTGSGKTAAALQLARDLAAIANTLPDAKTIWTPADFASFARAHRKRLLLIVTHAMGPAHRDAAEDVVQEALGCVWRQMSIPNDVREPLAWARQVAIRTALRYVQRERRMSRSESAAELSQSEQSDEQMDVAEQLIGRLPERRQRALRLRLEGRSYQEIADALGIAVGTVGALLHQARQQLRTLLLDENGR